jgi:hypothetical protein
MDVFNRMYQFIYFRLNASLQQIKTDELLWLAALPYP